MNTHVISELAWERMVTAVEKVHDRLRRAVEILERGLIPYAIIGDQAVASWIAQVDESAVRISQKVEIAIAHADLDRTALILEHAGFIHSHAENVHSFRDGPTARPRDCVQVFVIADGFDAKRLPNGRVLNLDQVVHMSLTAFRRNDCVNIRDLIDVGLVDASWCTRLPDELAKRLQTLLDDPDG